MEKEASFWVWHGYFVAGCPEVGTASVFGRFESSGESGAERGAPWDVGPLGGVGGAVGVGVEAGCEVDPGGASPVCVAGARIDGIVADHGAWAAALNLSGVPAYQTACAVS